jgi:TPR repeat protein
VAADFRCTDAESLLGNMLYMEKDFELAYKYLLRFESKDGTLDEALFQWNLFRCYLYDDNCTTDINKALSYLRRAVKLEHPDALATLGKFHYYGDYNVSKSEKKAMRLLKKSADLGSDIGKEFFNENEEKLKNTLDILKKFFYLSS